MIQKKYVRNSIKTNCKVVINRDDTIKVIRHNEKIVTLSSDDLLFRSRDFDIDYNDLPVSRVHVSRNCVLNYNKFSFDLDPGKITRPVYFADQENIKYFHWIKDKQNENIKGIRYDNRKRAVDTLFNIVRNNEFCSFVTLTFNQEIFDESIKEYDNAIKYFTRWVDNVRKVMPEFAYIGTFERQDNGNIHFHCLTNIQTDTWMCPKKVIRRVSRKSPTGFQILTYPEIYGWNLGYGEYKASKSNKKAQMVGSYLDPLQCLYKEGRHNWGFCEVKNIENDDKAYKKVLFYITKYISKEFQIGKRKILRSHNLNTPYIIRCYLNDTAYYNALSAIEKDEYDRQVFGVQNLDWIRSEYKNAYDGSNIIYMSFKASMCEYFDFLARSGMLSNFEYFYKYFYDWHDRA